MNYVSLFHRLLSEYEDDMFKMQSRLREQQQEQRDGLLAKLEARKRMKEELAKEQIVQQELHRLAQAEVRDVRILKKYFTIGSNVGQGIQYLRGI